MEAARSRYYWRLPARRFKTGAIGRMPDGQIAAGVCDRRQVVLTNTRPVKSFRAFVRRRPQTPAAQKRCSACPCPGQDARTRPAYVILAQLVPNRTHARAAIVRGNLLGVVPEKALEKQRTVLITQQRLGLAGATATLQATISLVQHRRDNGLRAWFLRRWPVKHRNKARRPAAPELLFRIC